MGILNITTDSFYDGGKYHSEKLVLERVREMLDEGADIIDIGAYSSRPGASDIDPGEELDRIKTFIPIISKEFPKALLSVDTFRSTVAEAAVNHGASFVNDISAGTADTGMLDVVARLKVPYILMHMKGNPSNMQKDIKYEDVVNEVLTYLKERVGAARNSGIQDIIIDPGFGFGKDLEHNYKLLAGLEKFQSVGCPILVGISRKSMIHNLLNSKPEKALNGTSVLNTLALLNGANILRVHDVLEAKEVVKIVSYIQKV